MTTRPSLLSSFAVALSLAFLLPLPSRADDLLDAVLWDGPPSSRTAPAPSTPPPAVPDVPVVPSAAPSAPPSSQPPSSLIPAASEPVSGDLQLRREIQEMRDRADRLEAALDTPAASPIPVPSWTLSFRGGVGSGDSLAVHGELVKRLGDSPFDLAIRGSVLQQTETRTSYYRESYYTYSYSRRWGWTSHEHTRKIYYDYDVDERNGIGDLHLIWRPLRDSRFSPYAGVGGRYEYLHFEGDNDTNANEGGFSLSGRVGLILHVPHFERLALKGEFIGGSDSTELLGEASLRLGNHFVLAAFVDSFDIDFGRATAFGGGFSLLF